MAIDADGRAVTLAVRLAIVSIAATIFAAAYADLKFVRQYSDLVAIFSVLVILGVVIEWLITRVRVQGSSKIILKDAVTYLHKHSSWLKDNHTNNEWFMKVQSDLRDALSLGHLKSFGRPCISTGEVPIGFSTPMQEIPVEHWRQYQLEVFDGMLGNKTNNFSMSIAANKRGFYDIHFLKKELQKEWPKLGPLERRKFQPLSLR